MIKRIVQILFAPIGGALGYWLWMLAENILKSFNVFLWGWAAVLLEIACISALAVTGYFVGKPVSKWVAYLLAKSMKKAKEMSFSELVAVTSGLLAGFLCAFLLCQIFVKISNEILVTCINALIYICFGFFGAKVAHMRHSEIPFVQKRKREESAKDQKSGTVLDSSILIDGRAYDIYKTGFLSEPIYIPKFILDELTSLADSEDNKKRTRGRIGLDTVKKLRENNNVVILDKDFSDVENTDGKIIMLAKELCACIMTNDYSLNMVASVQGIRILNINELVNALKPTVIAGDEISIEISKAGKEPTQGVGYLDDGTMVVVENGAEYVGKEVNVQVTSMLQTNAGKIIFAKIN